MVRRDRSSMVSAWWKGPAPQHPRPVTRGLLFGLPAALIAGILSAPATPAVAAPVSGKAAKPACPAALPDENAALVTARICGGPIAISSMTSETDEAVATPSGAVKLSHRFRPVRVRQAGTWVPVDTTLAPQADGTVAPKATTTGVVFSGGGTGPMVTISAAGKTLTVGSPVGTLPDPQLDPTTPDTATYPEVLPGVDLQLRADVDGYAQVLVIKDRQAATNSKLAALRFALSGKGLTTKADKAGNLRFTDAKGHLVFAGNTPQMWDASEPAAATTSSAASGTGRRASMATTVTGDAITVTPNAKLLADPATRYPVYLDPGVTANRSTWAQVDSATPTTAYWNGAGDAQVGTPNGGTDVWHSYFTLDLSTTPVAGTYISAATFNLNETWSASCTAKAMDLYATSPISSATTWNNQPGTVTWQSQATVAKGFSSSCPAGTVSMDATDGVRTAAGSSASVVTLGLAASNETDSTAFKKFSNNPTLDITYTAYPTTSALSTSPTTPCVAGSNRPYINTAMPLLQARITDPEGASVRPEFSWSTTGGTAVGSAQPTPGLASGQLFGTTVPAGQLTNGSSYAWKVRGYDGTVWGPWSTTCEFTVDTTAPSAAPSVSSTTYPSGGWGGATGTAGTFTLGASGVGDVASYRYGLDIDPNAAINATTLGGAASLSLTPESDGPHTLKVRTQDRAGNLSPVTTYTFNVGTGAVLSPGPAHVGRQGDAASTGHVDHDGGYLPVEARRQRRLDHHPRHRRHHHRWRGRHLAGRHQRLRQLPQPRVDLDQTVNNAEAGPDPLDGPVQVYASFSGTTTTASSAVKFAFDRDRASGATQGVGPGAVNLLTGNLTVSDTDVSVDAYGSDLTVARTYNTRQVQRHGPGGDVRPRVDLGGSRGHAEPPTPSSPSPDRWCRSGFRTATRSGSPARTSTAFDPELGNGGA